MLNMKQVTVSGKDKTEVFKKISECPFTVPDQCGDLNCLFYEDAPGYCDPKFCPLRGFVGGVRSVMC